jgi:hypothetical protein
MEKIECEICMIIPPSEDPRFKSDDPLLRVIGKFDFYIPLQVGDNVKIEDFCTNEYSQKHPLLAAKVVDKYSILKYSTDVNQSSFKKIVYVLECEDRDLMLESTDEINKIM